MPLGFDHILNSPGEKSAFSGFPKTPMSNSTIPYHSPCCAKVSTAVSPFTSPHAPRSMPDVLFLPPDKSLPCATGQGQNVRTPIPQGLDTIAESLEKHQNLVQLDVGNRVTCTHVRKNSPVVREPSEAQDFGQCFPKYHYNDLDRRLQDCVAKCVSDDRHRSLPTKRATNSTFSSSSSLSETSHTSNISPGHCSPPRLGSHAMNGNSSALHAKLRARTIFQRMEEICTFAARGYYLSQCASPLDKRQLPIRDKPRWPYWIPDSPRPHGTSQCCARVPMGLDAYNRGKERQNSRFKEMARGGQLLLPDYLALIAERVWSRARGGGEHSACLDAVHRMGNLYSWGETVVAAANGDESGGDSFAARINSHGGFRDTDATVEDGKVVQEGEDTDYEQRFEDSVFRVVMAARDLAGFLLCEEGKVEIEDLWTREWVGACRKGFDR